VMRWKVMGKGGGNLLARGNGLITQKETENEKVEPNPSGVRIGIVYPNDAWE